MSTTEALTAALSDRYQIDRLIGEGGMAKVYLARDTRHNRRVALKVLRPDLGAVVGVERFQAEIRTTANLQHPNLLPLFDSGAAGDLLYYVMPYIEGESLRARLDREKQLPVDEAIRIATAIAAALDYAHRNGVIHRDLKPENVLMQEGQPVVADFGIALAVARAGGTRITQTGLSLGTPQYMSPEQATGDRVIDARTDIYSLGALTYEMLTGEPPHVGATSQAIIARVLTEHPRAMRLTRPAIPEFIEAAVQQSLEKMPADRWSSAHDFAEALVGRQTGHYTSAAVAATSTRRGRARERTAWALVLILAAVAGGALLTRRPATADEGSVEFSVGIPDSLDVNGVAAASVLALSPDGRTLVFAAADRGGATKLYSRRLSERVIQAIPGTEGAISPVFGPDGREILFSVRPTGGNAILKRVALAGGGVSTVHMNAPHNGGVSWRTGREMLMRTADYGLALVSVDNGSERIVAKADPAAGMARLTFPDVLPGGKKALFTTTTRVGSLDSTTIALISLPDGKITPLGIHGIFPRYSTTGHILYVTLEQNLVAVPFDARRGRVTGSPVTIVEGVSFGSGGAAAVAVSANGILAYASGLLVGTEFAPVVISRAGARRTIGVATGTYRNPRVSPDGTQLVYSASPVKTSAASPQNTDIWRVDLATGRTTRVTTDGRSDRPLWSADGREIYFSANPKDSIEYAIGLTAGAKPRVLLHGPSILGSSDFGGPHGWAVLGVDGPVGADLWIAPMDSLDKSRVLAAEPYGEGLPRISPDGKFLAYQSARSSSGDIYVRPMGAGEEIRISSDGGSDPAWSRDGRELFYRSAPGDSMMAVEIERTPRLRARRVHALFSLSRMYTAGSRTSYDVMPNGDFILFGLMDLDTASSSGRRQVVVRTNWASQLPNQNERGRP